MQRRDFLKASAATTLTAATGPIILGADKKAGTDTPVIGIDGHRYECHHNWGTLPTSLEWQTTHNVAIDSNQHVYITQQGHAGKKGLDTVMVFDTAGKFVKSFGKEWHGGGHGIDVRKEGGEEFFYYTNTWKSPKVVKMNAKGETVWKLERPPTPEYNDPKKAYNPTNVAFCPNGDVFVGDGYGSNYMLKFDKDGQFLSIFGGSGKKDGQFATPHGNWIDERTKDKPTLVVCDRANARLQTFDLAGKHLSTTEKGTVLFPANIDIQGDTMLVPDLHARVSLFDKAGQPIVHLGEDKEWREKVVGSLSKGPAVRSQPKLWEVGKFVHPHDACFDGAGNIYVVEWVDGGRITFLKKV
ncbi:twin-arginine translocation signal domain-containing protein [Limnoglobus roseus]|uniref:Peptidase n=1 Tax=Limnoglobus roseus TaxID=2598579 RepID=A0A5C1A804_9BACT|nr:twin-arginine translocation signal domain-containing protein [Limnoglobus roseus]QEL15449.1 peptidase [Limnoglobus roseus]